jgi:hypothetical protein
VFLTNRAEVKVLHIKANSISQNAFFRLNAIIVALILICTTGFNILSPAKIVAASEERAIYLWWHGFRVLERQSERDEFFRIAQADQINTVYIDVNVDSVNWFTPGYRNVTNAWATFISQAKSKGIHVHALLSGHAPEAFTSTAAHSSYIQAILKYNIENPNNKIEGINWDIEPLVTNHVPLYTSYIKAMKAVTYGGQTVVSQGLILSVYIDPPRWLNMRTGATIDACRALYREFGLIDINSYADNLTNVIYQAADGPQICQEEGVKFHIGLETDMRDYNPGTLYEEGKDAYHSLQNEISAYFQPKYTMYAGQYTDNYQANISRWYMISSVSFPQGQYQPGQKVVVNATLRRSDSYSAESYGLKLSIRDSSGSVQEISKIVVISELEARQVSLEWTVPSTASGSYDLELSTWDVDLPSRGSTLLSTDYSGNKASLEAMTMAQLQAQTGLTGKRSPFVLLDHTSWQNDFINVTIPSPVPTTSTPTTSVTYNNADLNRDGKVNVLEQIIIGQRMGQTGSSGWIPEDLNKDGLISLLDMAIVNQNWTP